MNSAADYQSRLDEPVRPPRLLRILLVGMPTGDWYRLADNKQRSPVVRRLASTMQSWKDQPTIRFLASIDDDLLLVGNPAQFARASFYLIFEVESLEAVSQMLDEFRRGEPRLDRYFTVSAIIGRPFWPIEED